MTRFELEGGGWTEVLFFCNGKGEIIAFPSANADIVRQKGTLEARKLLEEVLEEAEG